MYDEEGVNSEMPAPLLPTKLHFPQARPNLVPRPRLIRILEKGLHGPLTLISAPAGSGKTTLMSEWRASSGNKIPAAWFSLDPADNDPLRFLSYLTASLASASLALTSSAASLLQSTQPPPLDIIILSLLEKLSTTRASLVIALDDYHVVTNLAVHNMVNDLLAHLPHGVHLIILTRADPPLPLARLRVRNQLTEIRANDLRFSVDEVAAFLSTTMGLSPSGDEVASLERRTEGWIAGLQLAALSMQGQDTEQKGSFVSRFSGSHHYIVDYLVEEVLDRQPGDVQGFLLETSLLDRLNATLCNAVTGRADGQAMLERLEQSNLFLIPLDDERQWYRYHHLFSDLLRARLGRMRAEDLPELQRRAAEWCVQQGFMEEAITYSLRAQDFERAAELVEEYAPTMSMQGHIATLLTWIEALPEEVTIKRTRLGLAEAWSLYFRHEFDETEARLERIERNLSARDADHFGGEIALWHGIVARRHGKLDEAEAFLWQSLEPLRENRSPLLGRAWVFLGLIRFESDANSAYEAFCQARDAFDAAKNIPGSLAAQYFLAQAQMMKGELPGASSTCQGMLRLARQVSAWPLASYAHLAMAELKYELNGLEAALEHAKKGLDLATSGGHTDNLFIATLNAARIERARGNWEEAERLIERASQLAGATIPVATTQVTEERVHLYLAQGKRRAAEEFLQHDGECPKSGSLLPRATLQLSRARCQLALHELDEASAELAGMLERFEKAGMSRLHVRVLCLQALILEAQDQNAEALGVFKSALDLARVKGYVRAVLDEGPPVLRLLQTVKAEGGVLGDYAGRLLSTSATNPPAKPSARLSQSLVDPLSERELEVLHLVAAGRSNRQIAEELVLATGTVKKHLNNIFGKMSVQNRTECVARARELDLLEAESGRKKRG